MVFVTSQVVRPTCVYFTQCHPCSQTIFFDNTEINRLINSAIHGRI